MREKRFNIFKILGNENKLTKVKLYIAYETVTDPYEKTKDISYLNPLTIKAYVFPIKYKDLKWKYYGNLPMGSVQIIAEKKYKNSVISAFKIEIDDEYYKCYSDDSKGFAIKEYLDYIVVVLEKKVNEDE